MTNDTCSVEVCDRTADKGSWCQGHAKRHSDGREMNTPIRRSSPHRKPYIERLLDNVNTTDPDNCWEWQGHTRQRKKNQLSYGRMTYVKDGRKTEYVHVISFELHNGRRVKPHLEIRHLCNNPKCVNPDHIVEGTRLENVQDSVRAGTHYSYFRDGPMEDY